MVTLVINDDNPKKRDVDIFEVYTQSQLNDIPFNVKKSNNISNIGTLTDVDGDGNYYFYFTMEFYESLKSGDDNF